MWLCVCADVRRTALAGAEAEFQKAGLLDDAPQSAAGLRVVQALLNQQHSIDSDEWNRLVPSRDVSFTSRSSLSPLLILTSLLQ